MKKCIAFFLALVSAFSLFAQDTLTVESPASGYFTTISIASIDTAQYQESTSTAADGGTHLFFTRESSVQRLISPVAAEEIKLSISPNPGKGVYTIRFGNYSILKVEVFSLLGVLVKEHQVPNAQAAIIDISELNKGIFFFRVTGMNGSIKTQKVILQ